MPAPVGSVVSGVQAGVGGVTSRLPGVAGLSGGSAGSVLGVGVNASPIATACVQAKGTGTALANVTVTVGGHNITAPLVQALPGILAPCPARATPASPGVGASAGGGLVGACVKATSQAPVNASVLVLDTELVGELTKAGVPLQQLVVPCPKGLTGGGSGSGAGGSGGGGSAGASGGPSAAGSAAGSGAPAGRAATSGGNGQGGSGSSCGNGSRGWSNLNAETLASVIPSNIPQTLPWILLALALLGRRRLSVAVAHVRALRGFRRSRLPA